MKALIDGDIFVFGSNLAGRHGKGAALHAKKYYGAIQGVGEGLQGQSYAIPTKDYLLNTLSLYSISNSIERFISIAEMNLNLNFKITRIGSGLAGYDWNEQIRPLFPEKLPTNCEFI